MRRAVAMLSRPVLARSMTRLAVPVRPLLSYVPPSTSLSMARSFSTTPPQDGGNNRPYSTDIYQGISNQAFSKEIADILSAPLDSNDIEIKPDGLIYLPEIKYRRILNKSFGPGGWGLKPTGPPQTEKGNITRPYALYCQGRFVSEAIGENQYFEGGHMSSATAIEGSKSNAVMRCCKDLGVGSELWDPVFIQKWKAAYTVEVLCEDDRTKSKKKMWRRKDRQPFGYPYKEVRVFASAASALPAAAPAAAVPPPVEEQVQSDAEIEVADEEADTEVPAGESGAAEQPKAEQFDINAPVPAPFKKINKLTWSQVFADKKHLQYLEWVTTSHLTPDLKNVARAALAYFSKTQ
eukprot:TRINITY_DN3477_c0_g2_i6.p1 TRINITY_DN3477_c0_g2~~TRINITY_DN3477_c0_g2_i6.p1  ORF type:complete len:363 (+),score=71.84 TRINITY_DN3477_c0_g2_i6:41-1090(+)